jgi:uncharacterized protein DUF1559
MTRRGFTRTDLAALIVIAVIIVAMATPPAQAGWPLLRAREAARRSECRRNLHNIGLGLGQWQADNDQNYPETVDYAARENMIANAWGRIYSVGYVNAEDVYACPSTAKLIKQHKPRGAVGAKAPNAIWTPNAATLYGVLGAGGALNNYDREYVYLLNSSYNYDNARIHKVAAAGRIVAGDGLERQWMRNADIPALDAGQKDAATAYVEPNHDDGANVCWDDKAVSYIKTTLNFKYWIPSQTGASVAGAPKLSVEMEPVTEKGKAPARPCLGGKYDWVRQGVLQSTRIEEDDLPNGATEHDDAYAIEGANPAKNADDWDLYRRLDGEVHCGTAALRNVFTTDWWESQP